MTGKRLVARFFAASPSVVPQMHFAPVAQGREGLQMVCC